MLTIKLSTNQALCLFSIPFTIYSVLCLCVSVWGGVIKGTCHHDWGTSAGTRMEGEKARGTLAPGTSCLSAVILAAPTSPYNLLLPEAPLTAPPPRTGLRSGNTTQRGESLDASTFLVGSLNPDHPSSNTSCSEPHLSVPCPD